MSARCRSTTLESGIWAAVHKLLSASTEQTLTVLHSVTDHRLYAKLCFVPASKGSQHVRRSTRVFKIMFLSARCRVLSAAVMEKRCLGPRSSEGRPGPFMPGSNTMVRAKPALALHERPRESRERTDSHPTVSTYRRRRSRHFTTIRKCRL